MLAGDFVTAAGDQIATPRPERDAVVCDLQTLEGLRRLFDQTSHRCRQFYTE